MTKTIIVSLLHQAIVLLFALSLENIFPYLVISIFCHRNQHAFSCVSVKWIFFPPENLPSSLFLSIYLYTFCYLPILLFKHFFWLMFSKTLSGARVLLKETRANSRKLSYRSSLPRSCLHHFCSNFWLFDYPLVGQALVRVTVHSIEFMGVYCIFLHCVSYLAMKISESYVDL